MGQIEDFQKEVKENIVKMSEEKKFTQMSKAWMEESSRLKYSYNFQWMGRPIIQYPQDIMAMQEIIWKVQPDLIIETGVAHGGSLIFYASMLELLGKGHVLGIDIDIRQHNREKIEEHPMYKRITLLEGSSVASDILEETKKIASQYEKVLVILDSLHTHDHVYQELQEYSQLVKKESYVVVMDSVIEFISDDYWEDRPWKSGNNPYTAVEEFLKTNDRFLVDVEIENKLQLTVAPHGYLRCIKDN